MKIAFFSVHSYDREYFNRFNSGHELIYFEAALDEHTVRLAHGCGAVCVFVNDIVSAPVLKALNVLGIKLVALRCAGYNNVDIAAARNIPIPVVRVPAYSPYAVAEHATALILTLNRKTHKAYNRVREGDFSLRNLTGFDMHGKTAGIIGTGRIGEVFAEIMLGFGCRVIACDLVENPRLLSRGVSYAPLAQLLPQCDIVSLHCPLTEQTHYIINAATLAQMKKGAMLINTSRGGLVDTEAAISALKTGHLGYLGIDVYEQEEQLFFRNLSGQVIQDDTILRLMSFPNVLITSHQGFFTDEALCEIARTTLQNISDFESGKPLLHAVK